MEKQLNDDEDLKLEDNEEDEDEDDLEDDDNEDEDEEPEQEEQGEGLKALVKNSKVAKDYRKKKRKAKKRKTLIYQKAKDFQQVLILGFLVLVVLMWGTIEGILHWLAGQEEITIVSKTIDNGCYEIITSDNESYCVDQASYDLAQPKGNYLLEEYEHYHIIREDEQREF